MILRTPSRTLTSAWIETRFAAPGPKTELVALSRVRGLKLLVCLIGPFRGESHSHECVD